MRVALCTAALLALGTASRACTAVVFAPGATTDGAAYTASSADCLDCDFRLARVPASRHANGATRAVYEYKANYPHVVREDRGDVWAEANLEGTSAQVKAWLKGRAGVRIGEIPEVPETYAMLETGAGYALLNEKMVGVSESTCSARFASKPVSGGGKALLDVSELCKIALERCGTARDAIEMMGALGEEFGYYGAEWDQESHFDEAGESMMVSDPNESWVFHILPDDTATKAIWAAQRVPEGEVAAVANQFLIREVVCTDKSNFICSSNLKEIAVKYGLHSDAKHGPNVDFSRVYGGVRTHSSYTIHRVYRVLTLVNPDLVGKLDPYPNPLMDGYPFSVKPKRKLSIQDMFRIFRDHYEGTPWDMTESEAAQPFGDPTRYDVGPLGNFTHKEIKEAGEFGRAISIARTSYVGMARSTTKLPREVGAMLYFSQQQPSSSVFVPVYLAAAKVPNEFSVGSLFKFHENSMFWAATTVSNWVQRNYRFAVDELRTVQKDFEEKYSVDATDLKAAALVRAGKVKEAREVLGVFSAEAATTAHSTYTKLMPKLIARFHDGYRMEDPLATNVKMTPLFYSLEWLSKSGYYSMSETGGGDFALAPEGVVRHTPGAAVQVSGEERDVRNKNHASEYGGPGTTPSSDVIWRRIETPAGVSACFIFIAGVAVGIVGTFFGLHAKDVAWKRRHGYAEIL